MNEEENANNDPSILDETLKTQDSIINQGLASAKSTKTVPAFKNSQNQQKSLFDQNNGF